MRPITRILALVVLLFGFTRAYADDTADAKAVIAAQVELIKKADVAAHLVNLAWNGLSGMEGKPTLRTIKP